MWFRLALLAALVVPVSARAVALDFTGATGQTVAATGEITDAELGTVTFSALPAGSPITWTSGAGLGIDCVGSLLCALDKPSEIDTLEVLAVSFDAPVLLSSVTFSQIWVEGPYGIVVEGGYLLGDTFALHFDADDGSNDGWLDVAVGKQVEWLAITAAGGWSKDFSLARLEATRTLPTPEPAAMALFVGGLGVVALGIRKAL
jgi:hypothetical protein